jgi:hypothetical protein
MSMITTPPRFSLHCRPQPLPCCPDMDRELPAPAPRADVRETEEVEGRRLPLALASQGFLCKPPEGDQPSLLLIQLQAILGEPLPEHAGQPFCVLTVLEARDEVIGEADEIHLTTQPRLHLHLYPIVEDMVQVHFGQYGTNLITPPTM